MKKVSLPEIKKDIQLFLTSEEGSIKKNKIVDFGFKIAVVTLAVSGLAATNNKANAQCAHGQHCSHSSHSSHGSHSSHASHSSHGSHGQW